MDVPPVGLHAHYFATANHMMLISELTKQDVLTALKAKRARAAAGLRTSAAHARWEEIQLTDVKPVIEFTRELMAAHLE
jgi:hypothetical protein